MMIKGLKLPVFYHLDLDGEYLESDPDNPLPLTEYQTRNMTFYQVDAVIEYLDEDDGDRAYGQVVTSGNRFITNLTPDEVNSKIERHLRDISTFTKQ